MTISVPLHINPLSAGASGYFHITYNTPEGWEDAAIISYEYTTSNIANMNGLQLTIVNVSNGNIHINYYAPKSMSAAVDGNIKITLRI